MSDNRSPTSTATALTWAKSVLSGNLRQGFSDGAGRDFQFTCPSPDSYPFQWAWDSAFHSIALSHVDPGRAQVELESLLYGMTSDGFLPHMLLWQDELRPRAVQDFRIRTIGWTSATISPPVLARAVERVFRQTQDQQWLSGILPRALACYEWLHEHRTNPDTGLLLTFQPDESGLDSSPKYDEALGLDPTGAVAEAWHQSMRDLLAANAASPGEAELLTARRFLWHDVLLNSIYADGLRALARLCRTTAGCERQVAVLEHRATAITDALCQHCWDDERGVFWDIDVVRDKQVRCLTASSLFPLILEDLPAQKVERLVQSHLLNEEEFWAPYPIPSVAMSEPSFDPDFRTGAIFRGSSWVNLNWYLCGGLRLHKYSAIATELAQKTIEMAAASGMRECYGPLDATGHGAREFGWSSLVLDLATEGDMTP